MLEQVGSGEFGVRVTSGGLRRGSSYALWSWSLRCASKKEPPERAALGNSSVQAEGTVIGPNAQVTKVRYLTIMYVTPPSTKMAGTAHNKMTGMALSSGCPHRLGNAVTWPGVPDRNGLDRERAEPEAGTSRNRLR